MQMIQYGAILQIFSLSHDLDNSIEYYMQDVINPIMNGSIISFSFNESIVGYPRFVDGLIQAQIIYDKNRARLPVLLVNYNSKKQSLVMDDIDGKINWDQREDLYHRMAWVMSLMCL